MPTFPLIRPTRAEVSLAAVRHNLRVARALAPKAEVLAVVKANAYGHGAVPIARAAVAEGAQLLGVALVEEGLELRAAGLSLPIVVLGGAYEGGYAALVRERLTPVVFREEHLTQLALAARAAGKRAMAHLKLDTGMGRIGVLPGQLAAFLEAAKRHPEVELEGILSHFANADLADAELTRLQIARFLEALHVLEAVGIRPRYRHLSNSAGVMSLPAVRDGLALNVVRPGLMLYGVSPAPGFEGEGDLKPALAWKTALTHVKTVPPGTPISYGSTWVAPRTSVIATLPVGYADGFSRALSNRGEVLVRGKRAKIAGRVCMDMTLLDVTDITGVAVGDEAVLIGTQGEDRITAGEMARWIGTIPYEVLCGIGARVPRIWREEEAQG